MSLEAFDGRAVPVKREVKFKERPVVFLDFFLGPLVTECVEAAVEHAKTNNITVCTFLNGVTFFVHPSSSVELLIEKYYKATSLIG